MTPAWQLYYGGLVLIFGSIFVVGIYITAVNDDFSKNNGLQPTGFAVFLILLGIYKLIKACILIWMSGNSMNIFHAIP